MPPRPKWSVNKENIFLNSIDLKSVADLDYEIAHIERKIRIDIQTGNHGLTKSVEGSDENFTT